MTQVELGPFVLDERIGTGGMGDVWRGRHRGQGTPVAVKVITPRWARDPRYADAVWREVEACARLHHPGIVSVFELGEIPYAAAATTFGAFHEQSPYFVMEYLPGGALEYESRTWSEIRVLLRALLDALAHAHARRVIHRDIKPTNVLLDDRGRPRLTDFGLAHVVGGRTAGPEEMSGASGTPRYMAPEQIVGDWREQGPWTDLYAVGCLAYGLVMGAPPYEGEVEDVLHAHINAPVPRAGSAAPDGFDAWLRVMMAKSPRRRFRRAADALWALLALPDQHDGEPPLASPPAPAALTTLSALTPFEPGHLRGPPEIPEDARTTAELELLPPTVPPMPDTFEREEVPVRLDALGAGLGIFGMRTVPLVGRRAEREVVWEELRAVRDESQPRAVVLRGEAGTGKSRLAEWIGERAHELGAATLLRVVHSPLRGANDGIAPMIAATLRLHGLAPAQVRERIVDFWCASGSDPNELFWCDALTRIVLGDAEREGVPHVRFSSAMQRWAAMTQFLACLAAERPLMVWLDDVQWGADALGLCRYVLDRADPHPVLFALTVRDDGLVPNSTEALRLEGVASHPRATTVRVGPLPDSQRVQLVRAMLGLDGDAARLVSERAQGNPLFAVQLVGDLIERDALELREGGFGLRPSAELDVPDDIHALWQRRIAHTLATLSPFADRGQAMHALEIAAALGQEVDDQEWHAVLHAVDIEPFRDLVAALVAHRLAGRTPRGWAFAHGMLRESLERDARAAGRWVRWNALCADVLEERLDAPESFRRTGDHLMAARLWERALEPLFRVALLGFDLGDYDEGIAALDRMEQAFDGADVSEDAPWRARHLTLRARILRERSDLVAARELLGRAEPIARAHGANRVLAEVLGTRASICTLTGDLDTAQALIAECLEIWRREGDAGGLGHALRTQNWLLFWTGDYEGARGALDGAARAYAAAGDDDGLGWVAYEKAAICLHNEELDRAADLTAEAIVHFDRVGNVVAIADCANMHGEVARLRGELELAESLYREALDVYEPLGHANTSVARENLGLTLLAAGKAEEAKPVLAAVLRANEATGRTPFVMRLSAELIECTALLDDPEWSSHFERYDRAAAATTFADHDTASALERAGDLWARHEATERARRAWSAASTLWERLGRDERLREVEVKLAALRESRP